MKEPKIIYKRVIINNSNVDQFLTMPQVGGYSPVTNNITLMDFYAGPDLPAFKKYAVDETIDGIRQMMPVTLAHEKRHWHHYNNVGMIIKNQYQSVVLCALEELSATTAGYMQGNPIFASQGVTADTVICSMFEAACHFTNDKILNCYLNDFVAYAQESVKQAIDNGSLNVHSLKYMQYLYEHFPDTLFDKEFDARVKALFTYDGYCIFDEKNIPFLGSVIWRRTQDYIQQIKKECMSRTYTMTQHLINSNTR